MKQRRMLILLVLIALLSVLGIVPVASAQVVCDPAQEQALLSALERGKTALAGNPEDAQAQADYDAALANLASYYASCMASGADTPSIAALVTEVEPNNSLAGAQNVNAAPGRWTLMHVLTTRRPGRTSASTAQAITQPTSDSFTVAAGTVATFDIDYGMYDLDSMLRLWNSSGGLLAFVDDYGYDACTAHSYDSYLGYEFSTAGTYVIEVLSYYDGPVYPGQDYLLQISLTAAPIPSNSPPTLAASGPATTNEGSTAVNSGAYSDTNAGDNVAISASVGAVTKTGTNSGTWSWSFGTSDGPNQSQTVTITANDGNGEITTTTFGLTVSNVAPTIAISGAGNVNEGSPYSLTLGAVTDPGADTVSAYIVHWGDGNTDSYGSNGVQTHTYADGPNSYNITVDLTDEDGTFLDQANALSVTVDNVEPTIAISGASNVNEGSPYGLTLGTVTDPGTDTVSAYLVHWGDGNSDSLVTHTYADGPNNYNITVDLTDEDGTFLNRANALSVTVDNVAPTITGITIAATPTLTGTPVTFTGSATDPSAPDTTAGFGWQWSVDGGAFGAFGAANANTFTTTFLTCGIHTVTAQARDKDLGVSAPFASGSVSVYEAHFLQPLDEGKFNLVQKGRVVPVKISIGCNGVPLAGLTPAIQLLSGDQTAGNETALDDVETFSASAADTTGIMRPADSMYIYNLQVPSTASVGALYTIRVRPYGTGADLRVILKIRK